MCLHGFTRTLHTQNIFVRKGLNIMKININQYRLRKRPKLAIQRLWSFLATNLNSVVESNFESTKSSTYLFKAIKKPQLCTIYLQNIHFYAMQPLFFVIFQVNLHTTYKMRQILKRSLMT